MRLTHAHTASAPSQSQPQTQSPFAVDITHAPITSSPQYLSVTTPQYAPQSIYNPLPSSITHIWRTHTYIHTCAHISSRHSARHPHRQSRPAKPHTRPPTTFFPYPCTPIPIPHPSICATNHLLHMRIHQFSRKRLHGRARRGYPV